MKQTITKEEHKNMLENIEWLATFGLTERQVHLAKNEMINYYNIID